VTRGYPPASEWLTLAELTTQLRELEASLTGGTTLPSPGAEVDVGPAMQAAFDARRAVSLTPGATYFLNTPIFFDSSSGEAKYVLNMNGAVIKFGPGLPAASTLEGLAATRIAFFPNTKRTALSGGTVTTTTANAATAGLPPAPRLVVRDGILNANGNEIGFCYGNGAATVLDNIDARKLVFGISWGQYTDLNGVRNCQATSPSPAGTTSKLIYQRSSGDGTFADNCKSFGGVILDLASCKGFRVSAAVGAQYLFQGCTGIFEAGHQETDEVNIPYSITLDRTRMTLLSNRTEPSKNATKYTVRIADTASHSATNLHVIDHNEVYFPRSNDAKDAVRGPSIYVESLNANGKVRVTNSKTTIQNGVNEDGINHPEGFYIASAVAEITTALTAGADQIATGNFELSYGGAWAVGNPGGLTIPPRHLTAPTLASAADATGILGALSSATTYQYVAACKRGDGRYTILSSAVTA
jgi:hypothetical protein